tara:strand:- start:1678 stop:2850 length:1173 start_codon:yes stop_codon:yes gene_type:complete
MGLPYENEDYGESEASTINNLIGFNHSTLDNNELMKRVDANNVGGTSILNSANPAVSNVSSNVLTYYDGDGDLISSITHAKDESSPGNTLHKVNILPNALEGEFLTVLHSEGDAECRVGINVADPEETLDIEGNLQLRSGSQGKIFFKHPSGLQKVELDGNQDGTNGGKFIVKTKVDGGSMTQKFEINNDGAIGLGVTPTYGTAGQVLTSNGSGSGVTWVTPAGGTSGTNYTFYNTTDLSLKSGNGSGGHNNNTYGSWVGIYNQSNVLQLSPSITLGVITHAVKIETNIHARVDRVRLGFRIIRVVAAVADVVVVGSEQWGRAIPDNVVDDDHFTYCISIVDVPGVANVTYRAEVYASDPGGAGNSFFEINSNLVLGGGTNNVNMLLTEL